ncbi:hypothetical protein PLESTB_000874900 [Pleodorina starrii]|uniref:Uncharacterized protein n=1 Tax=Pleodorina starrii TaxID=330485 RepID=A0A9W6BMK6_9CHLO|nr:hypothetical protein PLESTM_001753100 [Pleodorina starrii]GLC54515.1 hypothetical protein PLESTB_000874900 [Pleodorina starrii]GLC76106.1 hypothetical protein PLESTF_001735600 [Pleodorina starrii]
MANAIQATEPEQEGTSDPQEPVWGKVVAYSGRKGAQKFHWTETGRHGLALVRRCAFLQHVSKARSDPATRGVDSRPGSGSPSSGAARCLSLIQDNGGSPRGGCLARAAEAFLEAAWAEVRRVALRELRDYAAVMASLERAQEGRSCPADSEPGPDAVSPLTAAAAVLHHVWRRCHLWAALRWAPSDLLGELNLNEAFVEALAPEPLAALRGATAALLDSWRAGLVQLGELLHLQRGNATNNATNNTSAAAVSEPAEVDSDAGGPLRGGGSEALERMNVDSDVERRAAWLLSWRLYLTVYRRLETVWAGSSKLSPSTGSLEQFLREGAGIPASLQSDPPCGKALSAADGAACRNSQPILTHGPIAARSDARGAPDSAARRKSSAAGDSPSANARPEALAGRFEPAAAAAWRRIGAQASAAVPPLPPLGLLDNFVSACARTAVKAVTSCGAAAGAATAGLFPGDPLGCGCSCGGPSATKRPPRAAADHALRATCVHVTTQLRDALAEDLSDVELERHGRLVSVTHGEQLRLQTAAPGPAAAAAATTTTTAAAAIPSFSSSVVPPPSRPASGGAAVQPGTLSMSLEATPCSAAPQENTNERSSAPPGVTGTSQATATAPAGTDSAAATLPPGALLAELPPGRVARLGCNPGLALLQLQLTLLAQRSPAAAAGSEALAGLERAPFAGGREDAAERHARQAALVYGVCAFLHQTHDELAAAHTVSGISPSQVPEEAPLPSDRAALGLPPAPQPSATPPSPACSTRMLQTPSEALAARIDAAAATAGAAALAAEGAHPVQPPANGAAVAAAAARAAAASRATAWVAARRRSGVGSCGAEAAKPKRCPAVLNHAAVQGGDEEGASNRAEAGASAWGSPAWACELESRVASLLAAAAGAAPGERGGAAAMNLTAVTTAGGCGVERVAAGGRPSCGGGGSGQGIGSRFDVFLEALLMYAGRVRLLGVSFGAPSSNASRGLPQYRWGAAAAAVDDVLCSAAAAPAAPPCDGAAAAAASFSSAPLTTASGAHSGCDATTACCLLAASPACRALLLHAAVTAATAATNRLVHMAALHALGSGSDLRPLCAAHSDAVALGSAAQALLSLRLALCTTACSGVQAHAWEGGEAAQKQQHPSAALGRSAVGSLAVKAHSAAAGQGDGAAVPDGDAGAVPGLAPRQRQPASPAVDRRVGPGEAPGSSGGGRGLRLTAVVKFNWRRSLRRIMPSRFERGGGGHGRERATAAVGLCPSPSSCSTAPPRPPARRACWADEPIEPVPLPPPAPLCSIATAHLEAAAAAQTPLAAAAAGTAPWWRQVWGANPASAAAAPGAPLGVSEGSDGSCGGCSSSRGSAFMAMVAEEWQWARAGLAASAAMLVLPSGAEAGVLLALHTVSGQLRATAARAGKLLEAEMGHRAAMICGSRSTTSSGSSVSSGAAGGQAAGPAQVVATNLLRPLREALAGLHPISQSELLGRGFSAALRALQQQQQCPSGRGGPSRPSGGGAAGQLREGLALIEEELAAGWRQIEAALAKAAVPGWEAGKCDFTWARRRELEAQIRSLRSEVGDRAAAA